MSNCKPIATTFLLGVHLEDGKDSKLANCTLYCQLVGCFLYLTHSHPDLSYVVGIVSRYMQEPHELHWKSAKCIFIMFKELLAMGFII